MLVQLMHKHFLIKYKIPFFFSKFLLNQNTKKLFMIKFIRYNIDINKYSIMNIFWTFLLLFGQLPRILFYTKQMAEKISSGSLSITQTFPRVIFYIYKLINFFLLSSTPNLQLIKKKVNSLLLSDNSYYPELSYFFRFFVNLFNINLHIAFYTCLFLSTHEKITIFRLLQLPISLIFAQQKRRKRFIYKKLKVNKIK